MKEDQPLSQTLFSSAYRNQVPKKYQVNRGVVKPTDKTKSNPLANQKNRLITKCVGKFLVFPRGHFAPKELPALKHGTKRIQYNKSAS